jgi:hypothetical protein
MRLFTLNTASGDFKPLGSAAIRFDLRHDRLQFYRSVVTPNASELMNAVEAIFPILELCIKKSKGKSMAKKE